MMLSEYAVLSVPYALFPEERDTKATVFSTTNSAFRWNIAALCAASCVQVSQWRGCKEI